MVRGVKKRKILVFAHVPLPHHGQSVMVQVLLDGLRADPRFEVHHVDARVSDDMEDIGSFRPQKFIRLFKCILQAWWIRLRHGRMAFYYVPAPAKRSAIIRDWVVMAFCRPLFPELILHWHAYGLGEWAEQGRDWQRRLTRLALGNADLSIVLNNYNKRDAEVFASKRVEVVPNGIADLFPDYETVLAPKRRDRAAALKALGALAGNESRVAGERNAKLEPVRFLFLGHLMESKGVFVAMKATEMVNNELRRTGAPWRLELVLAGSFVSEAEKTRVQKAIEEANQSCGNEEPCVSLAGFLDSGQKKSALEKADGLVFPTFYENEAQPLVLFEAMCAGLPVVTTSWRGIAEPLPRGYPLIVEPGSAASLAAVLADLGGLANSECLRTKYECEYKMQLFAPRIADIFLSEAA
jgi:glycosyltransferase involved in cell wall biosynthesis